MDFDPIIQEHNEQVEQASRRLGFRLALIYLVPPLLICLAIWIVIFYYGSLTIIIR